MGEGLKAKGVKNIRLLIKCLLIGAVALLSALATSWCVGLVWPSARNAVVLAVSIGWLWLGWKSLIRQMIQSDKL